MLGREKESWNAIINQKLNCSQNNSSLPRNCVLSIHLSTGRLLVFQKRWDVCAFRRRMSKIEEQRKRNWKHSKWLQIAKCASKFLSIATSMVHCCTTNGISPPHANEFIFQSRRRFDSFTERGIQTANESRTFSIPVNAANGNGSWMNSTHATECLTQGEVQLRSYFMPSTLFSLGQTERRTTTSVLVVNQKRKFLFGQKRKYKIKNDKKSVARKSKQK